MTVVYYAMRHCPTVKQEYKLCLYAQGKISPDKQIRTEAEFLLLRMTASPL